jgi:hypothetical protein
MGTRASGCSAGAPKKQEILREEPWFEPNSLCVLGIAPAFALFAGLAIRARLLEAGQLYDVIKSVYQNRTELAKETQARLGARGPAC